MRIGSARPDIPDVLNDRAQDNWESLLAIADLAGGIWPRLARTVAIALSGGAEDDSSDGSRGVQLLADLRRYFDGGNATSYPTETLLRYLHGIGEAPWASFTKAGKPMTARHLAGMLRPYKIIPRSVRVAETARTSATDTPKGYHVADFADAFSRYLPDIRHNATSQSNSGFSPDSVSATDSRRGGYDDNGLASQQADSGSVADKTEGTGTARGGVADVADSDADDWF